MDPDLTAAQPEGRPEKPGEPSAPPQPETPPAADPEVAPAGPAPGASDAPDVPAGLSGSAGSPDSDGSTDTPDAPEPAGTPSTDGPETPDGTVADEPVPDPQGMLVLGGAPLRTGEPDTSEPPAPENVCGECGGTFGPEGYCDRCGAARPDERLHYEIDAGHGVAAVCDRGIRHVTNEDAAAVSADDDGTRRLALVVSDGVSSAPRSAEASTAAVQAALEVLTSTRSTGLAGVAAAKVGALTRRLVTAAEAAADAVREVTEAPDDGSVDRSGIPKAGHPACTLVAAVVEGDVAAVGSIGDSRAYWLPDSGPTGDAEPGTGPQRLTTDDSWANEQIRLGVDPAEAERGRHAHTITKWLGVDCPDITPQVTTLTLTEPGYLLVCSDGLWNYASAPEEIDAAVQQARSALPEGAGVLELAGALVDWANARGGQDNVTVALARIDATGAAGSAGQAAPSQAEAGTADTHRAAEPTQETD